MWLVRAMRRGSPNDWRGPIGFGEPPFWAFPTPAVLSRFRDEGLQVTISRIGLPGRAPSIQRSIR